MVGRLLKQIPLQRIVYNAIPSVVYTNPEIATVGINGISPDKKYSIKSIPDKEFGGYEFLAYYYVSWAREFPDALDKIGLPFNKAYETALEMYKSKNNNK